MAVTTDLLEAFLKCPTKCFLLSRGESGTGNAYANWVRAQGDTFRSEGIGSLLMSGVTPDRCATGPAATLVVKPAQWQFAFDFVPQSENLRCSCDAVERIPS